MNKAYFYLPLRALTFGIVLFYSCNGGSPATYQEERNEGTKVKVVKNYQLSDAVRCSFLDREGIMWFGTNNEGIYRFDGTSFTQYSLTDGLCSNYISAITEDDEGNLWFGTDQGLCRFDKKTFTSVAIPWDGNENLWGEGMNANLVLSLFKDKHRYIWLGTWGNGAHRFDPSVGNGASYKFDSFLQQEGAIYDDSLHRNVIQSIIEDDSGNIWLTSMSHGGVSRFDGTNFTHFMPTDGLSDDMVFSAFKDRAGNLWFGMLGNRNGGLDRYNGSSFTLFNEADGLCNSNITCIYEDRSGKLWLGSSRGNLCIYDPKADGQKFTHFTSQDGQHFTNIRFVTEDAVGNIWFGGNYGRLFRYDGRELTDFTNK